MPVIAVFIKTLLAFCDRDKIIVSTGRTNVEEISSSFACFDTLAEKALVVPVVVKIWFVVRHSSDI